MLAVKNQPLPLYFGGGELLKGGVSLKSSPEAVTGLTLPSPVAQGEGAFLAVAGGKAGSPLSLPLSCCFCSCFWGPFSSRLSPGNLRTPSGPCKRRHRGVFGEAGINYLDQQLDQFARRRGLAAHS